MHASRQRRHERRAGRRTTPAMSKRRAVVRLAALALLIAGAALLVYTQGLYEYRDPAALASALRDARGVAGIPLFFLGIYTVATAFGLPGTPLMLGGGAIFGLGQGILLNWIGAVLGSAAAYGIARRLGRDATRRLLGARAARLDRFAAEHGFATVFRLRLVPIIPFIALNYGSALAGIRLRDYLLATALGILPAVAIYTYFADALVAGIAGARDQALLHVAIAAGLLIALSFVPTLLRRRDDSVPDGIRPPDDPDGG